MQKISDITFSRQYEGREGKTMFVNAITLDDGTKGEVTSITKDRWSVGDEVQVTRRGTGNKGQVVLSLSKPSANFIPTPSGGGGDARGKKIDASWALSRILELYGVQVFEWEQERVVAAGKKLISMRDDIANQ